MENPGFDPGASRLQSAHSTDWANPPLVQLLLIVLDLISEDRYYFFKNKIYNLLLTAETSSVQSLHLAQRELFSAPFPAWSGSLL